MHGEQQKRPVGENTIISKHTKGTRIISDSNKCYGGYKQVDMTMMEGGCTQGGQERFL